MTQAPPGLEFDRQTDSGHGSPHRRATVVVLPYAGAARMPVGALRRAVGPEVEIVAPTYPGHGARINEEAVTDPEVLLPALIGALRDRPSRPLVLLGFSMGGRLAYELAWRLADDGDPPAGLVACASRAPHTGIGHRPIASLPFEEFQRAAVELGLLAPGLETVRDSAPFVRALQADLTVLENMPRCRTERLPVPCAVIGARADWLVPERALRAWDEVMDQPVRHLRIPGGHLDWLTFDEPASTALRNAIQHVLPALVELAGARSERPIEHGVIL